jgi:hypothetical protein
MNILVEHNLKIFNELYNLIEFDHKVNLEKDKDKNYFSFFINNQYYSIGSYYYNNDIRIDLIGKDDNNVFRILEVFEHTHEIFNYFYENKCEDLLQLKSESKNEFQEESNKYNNDNLNKINKNRKRKYWNRRK